MKILILGAAGRIAKILSNYLLEQTEFDLVLYARNANTRIKNNSSRIKLIDGDFTDKNRLRIALENVDAVYLNHMANEKEISEILDVIKTSNIKKIIVASILGIYDEVAGEFGEWNKKMVGTNRIHSQKQCAKLVEDLGFDYTILRLTWLYNNSNNTLYSLTQRDEPFIGAQVTREAVAKFIVEVLTEKSEKFKNSSIGVSEPNTNWPKPGFY